MIILSDKNNGNNVKPLLIFDIETDGLLHSLTKVHCLSIYDEATGEHIGYPPERVLEGIYRIYDSRTTHTVCGHNIIAFDLPALAKLYPWFKQDAFSTLLDTRVWSQLVVADVWALSQRMPKWRYNCPPNLATSHSLKAWGYRLGILKGTTPDESWQTYSPEMLDYCMQDVVVTRALVKELMKWTTSDSAVELEMEVARILRQQEENGVCFNVKAAEQLASKLLCELESLNAQLQLVFPEWQVLRKRAISKVNNKKLGRVKGEPYEIWDTVSFNPSSNPHVVYKLQQKYGWEPSVFTDKGNPQMDDAILIDLENMGTMPEVTLIRQYRTARKILGYISAGDNSWLNHVGPDGKIHGNVQGCGAGTRRMTHNSPNLGQVPSNRAYLGKECRSLFGPPPGYVMFGVDADQLELRTLSHYLYPFDGGTYAEAAVNGSKEDQTDIHWRNAKAIGVDRDSGKTIFYAYVYGSGVGGLGKAVTKSWDQDLNHKVGTRIKRNLERGLPALVELKDTLLSTAKKRGYLYDLDGQMFRLRSNHSALNELNQRAGAILMKRAEVWLDQQARALGLDFLWLLHIHDEWQFAVREKDVPVFRQLVTQAFEYTTSYYKMKCPITGKGGQGNDWSETH